MGYAGSMFCSVIRNGYIIFGHRYKVCTGRGNLLKPEKDMIACYFLEESFSMLHFQWVNLTVWEKNPWTIMLMYIQQSNSIILISKLLCHVIYNY